MRETRSYGSVRGPGRKARPYSDPRLPSPITPPEERVDGEILGVWSGQGRGACGGRGVVIGCTSAVRLCVLRRLCLRGSRGLEISALAVDCGFWGR